MRRLIFSLMLLVFTNWKLKADPLGSGSSGFFIENKGQWPKDVMFLGQLQGLDVWITRNGVVYNFYRAEEVNSDNCIANETFSSIPEKRKGENRLKQEGHVIKLHLVRGKKPIKSEGVELMEGHYNYFIGDVSSKWVTNVRRYKEVWVEGIYDGIKVRYYYNQDGIRYDFWVAPYAKVEAIQLEVEGTDEYGVTEKGELFFQTRFGKVRHIQLKAFQKIGGETVNVECRFVQRKNGELGFELGKYDPSYPLVIDPLVYATFIGGTGDDQISYVVKDGGGYIYVAGHTYSSDYPTTAGAYDTTYNGDREIFITKLDPNASSLIYSTFIGGNGAEWPGMLWVDAGGNTYITGGTASSNFPTTAGVYDPTHNGGWDLYVTKLNSAGDSLAFSTYLGGNFHDWGNPLFIDNMGNIYVGGYTTSNNFPTTTGVYDQSYNGGADMFIAKLDSNASTLLYSTYIGGSSAEDPYDIYVDAAQNVYVVGWTTSHNYPTTPGSYDSTFGGGYDAIVTKLNNTGSALVYSTYIGGGAIDIANSCEVDGNGNIYVAGYTTSSDYPTTVGAYDFTYNGNSDVFVTKLNGSGSTLAFSTFVGGSGNDRMGWASSLTIDNGQNVYLVGHTTSSNFPTTSNAYDTSHNGGSDAFVATLNPSGNVLLYSTFLGGSSNDEGKAIWISGAGAVDIGGYTASSDFPVTSGAYDVTHNGSGDGFVAQIVPPPLPVEWLQFSVRGKGRQVHLEWATASEQNSKSFEVERSDEGKVFSSIASVPAAGYSTTIRRYNYVDENPLRGISYYRIRQEDFDGKVSYSEIRKVWISKESVLRAYIRQERLYVEGVAPDTHIRIYDSNGRIIWEGKWDSGKGIETSGWQAAKYFMECGDKGVVEFIKP